jgi:hypothetical protein
VQYILLIYGDESSGADMSAEEQGKTMQEWTDYTQWLRDKGWYLGGDALYPTSQATTVRGQGATPVTTDGPFAETKEQLGGYYLVECKDLDEAIEASSKMPIRGGGVEIRPVMLFDDEGRPRQ